MTGDVGADSSWQPLLGKALAEARDHADSYSEPILNSLRVVGVPDGVDLTFVDSLGRHVGVHVDSTWVMEEGDAPLGRLSETTAQSVAWRLVEEWVLEPSHDWQLSPPDARGIVWRSPARAGGHPLRYAILLTLGGTGMAMGLWAPGVSGLFGIVPAMAFVALAILSTPIYIHAYQHLEPEIGQRMKGRNTLRVWITAFDMTRYRHLRLLGLLPLVALLGFVIEIAFPLASAAIELLR